MASRHITGAMLRICFGAVHKQTTPAKLLTAVCENLAFVQKDLDKTGDKDMYDYYCGMIDAYEDVAMMIAPIKNEPQFNALLDKSGTRYSTKENAA